MSGEANTAIRFGGEDEALYFSVKLRLIVIRRKDDM